VQGPTGIDENSVPSFVLYPNPSSGKIFFRVDSKESQSVQFSIFDMVGKKIFEKDLNFSAGQNVEEVILENVGKGIYVGHLDFGKNSVNQKIIINK